MVIGVSARRIVASSGRYDAVICLACVVRGATPHFDYVAGEAARGLQEAALATGVPIVFGVLVVRMVEIGLMTPPVGLNVYVLKGVAKGVSMADIFRGCGWFVFVDIINVAILIAFPAIILLIPSTMIR